MRSDMFELLLERPRGYRGRHGRKAPSYPRAKMSAGALDGSALVEPYGTRYRTKWLAENLAPLRRWLGQQVGRPWDRVYSELSEHLSPNNAVKQHVRDHVDDFVELHVIEHDGRLFTAQGTALGLYRRRRSVLYVCPRTGLLRELARQPRASRDPRPLADGRWLVRRGEAFVYVATEALSYGLPNPRARTCALTKLRLASPAYRAKHRAGDIPWGWGHVAVEAYIPDKKRLRELLREAERVAAAKAQRP